MPGSNLKHESNDDERFVRGGNTNRRGFNGGKNGRSVGNTGKNLVMENVTIIKRGEKIEDVIGTLLQTSLHAAENFLPGGKRVSGGYFHGSISEACSDDSDDSRRAMDRKSQSEAVVGGSKFASARTVQKRKKTKSCFRNSHVSPSYDLTAKSDHSDGAGSIDELDKLGNIVITSEDRLGPDPSTVSKELSSGILRSVLTGSKFSKSINDADLPVSLPKLVTKGSVESGTRPASSPGVAESSVPNSLLDWWAESAYTNSPSPRCLPLPKFFTRPRGSNSVDSNGLAGDES